MTIPAALLRPMTREQFKQFLRWIRFSVAVRAPYSIVECQCGDINCHGWRLVTKRRKPAARRTS